MLRISDLNGVAFSCFDYITIDNICSFLTEEGVDFVTVACEDQSGDLNLHHYERKGVNDGLPSNYVSELTREGVVLNPDIFDREWKGAKNTITERKFVRVYRIPRINDEKVVFSGSIAPLAEHPKSVRVYQIPRKKKRKNRHFRIDGTSRRTSERRAEQIRQLRL